MSRILKQADQKFNQIARSRGNETVKGERIVKKMYGDGQKAIDRRFR